MLLLPRPQKWILQWLPQHTLVVLSHVRLFVRVCKGIKGRLTVPFWMNFRKIPNGLWPPLLPHPYFWKQWCAFFWMCLNLQLNFLDRKWPPPSFWNFSKKSSKMEKGSVPEWAICKNLEHWCIAVCCQKLPEPQTTPRTSPNHSRSPKIVLRYGSTWADTSWYLVLLGQ